MRKDEFLSIQLVKEFINWLAKKLDAQNSFNHIYYEGKGKKFWSCNCLHSAYKNYYWNGYFKANQEINNKNSTTLHQSILDDNRQGILRSCNSIFISGRLNNARAARTNSEWLINNSNQVIDHLKSMESRQLLNLDVCDTNDQRLRQIKINSGFINIYSHIINNLIMYDGRVGAALGLFVRLYCEENHLQNIPPELLFAFHGSNPSSSMYRFPTLSNRNYLDNNIRASWLLGNLLEEYKSYFDYSGTGNLRALEAALFMIGYNITGIYGSENHELRHKYLIELHENWQLQKEQEENTNSILLHRELLLHEPNNLAYRYSLAKILVDIASNEKEIRRNYEEARKLLNESLRLVPRNIRSRYYLGMLAAIEEKWDEGIRYLNFEIDPSILSREEKIRAFYVLAVCNSSLGNVLEAEQALKHAKDLNKQVINTELLQAELQVRDKLKTIRNKSISTSNDIPQQPRSNVSTSFSEERRVILTTKKGEKIMPGTEADEIYESNEECVVLDLRQEVIQYVFSHLISPSNTFTLLPSQQGVTLEPKEADLLAFLMVKGDRVSTQILKKELWKDSENNGVVRQYILRLRKKLEKLYPEVAKINIIDRTPIGYAWTDIRPFKIIQKLGLNPSL
ncbi:MAG TPA: winged helix-turn-helix domain-containing protein [Desulfosporosinus sp.]|nr:winged helix-turn-helix domain-containing protein [Desulfosporosinus sp.]